MAQENIQVQQSNFCIAPLVGTYASIDTTNTTALFLVKNSSGDTTVSYTFNPNISQNTNIYYFDYIGPRNLSSMEDGMVFITMESNGTSEVNIKKWNLNKSNTRLDLDYTITKSTSGSEIINSTSMAAGRYYTNLSETTVTGTGSIVLDSTKNIVSGTRLYVGPSSNTSYLGAYEEVIATSVSGNTVSIESSDGVPLLSYFNATDSVVYLTDFYLFCNSAYNNLSKGVMYTIDNYSGQTKKYHNSALYNGIETANYGIPYEDTVGVIKNSELLYIDQDNYSIKRSSRLNITKPSSNNVLPVFAVAFTESSVFTLQDKYTIRDDSGNYAELSWTTYNYYETGVSPFADSITLNTNPIGIIANQETITIECYVRDQYGFGMAGKTVQFDKVFGDTSGTWSDVNRQGTTDINGFCSIDYTSGWYDHAEISDINETIRISASTNGSNVLTGSIYIWTYLNMYLNAKFIMGPETSPTYGANIIKQKENIFESTNSFTQIIEFNSELSIKAYAFFTIPGGHNVTSYSKPILQQWREFESDSGIEQEELKNSKFSLQQTDRNIGNCPVSQTYVSRHLAEYSNEDDVDIAQFKFIIDATPKPFSEKNNVNANIWIKLAPYGFDLNQSTLVFRVREVSYMGDTGFISYESTANLQVIEYDAGGGLIGLDILYTPDRYFYNSAIVYVYLEVYDNALPPNKIEFDYWFKIIPDFKAPYITNESPSRNAVGVPTNSNIEFNILDTEVGVDIDSLEFFINNRKKDFTYEVLEKGYKVTYINDKVFFFEQPVEVSIRVTDSSENENVLYDMWRFYCINSLGPWVDTDGMIPTPCFRGMETRTTKTKTDIFDSGHGIDKDSIELIVDGKIRPINTTPILKRLS